MAATATAQNKVKSKSSKAKTMKTVPSHPTYLKMIQEAIASIKDRKGATRPAIKTFILGKYNLDDSSGTFNRVLNSTLKKGVIDGTFKQPRGNHGRFGLGEGTAVVAKKRTSKAKKSHSASIGKKNGKAGTTLATPKVKSARKPSLSTSSTGRKKKGTARMRTGLSTPTSSKKAAVKKSAKSPVTKPAKVAKKASAKTKSSAKAKKTPTKAQSKDAHSTPTPTPLKKASSAKKQPSSSSKQSSAKATA